MRKFTAIAIAIQDARAFDELKRHGSKDVSLKVIGAGFGRTGTYSLKLALDILGFGPCHHMYEIRNNLGLLPDWSAVARGATPNWDKMFSGFNAQVDWPGAAYWKELSQHFPKAKVILTTRDPDEWFDSMQKTIAPSVASRGTHKDAFQNDIGELVYETALKPIFNDRLDDRSFCTERFRKHIAEVRGMIAPDRLLEFDIRDGWQPLCDFLGVNPPKINFPISNSSSEFNSRR